MKTVSGLFEPERSSMQVLIRGQGQKCIASGARGRRGTMREQGAGACGVWQDMRDQIMGLFESNIAGRSSKLSETSMGWIEGNLPNLYPPDPHSQTFS